ncbi:MAG TPA: LLM class flavin-dependent oxidoreductase [Solirubrobacterales bacterium]|jgi:alkanesulfonate monooxygenase SsuD/methylene tetrahydromethanopterin reductase-like flavin-dependent oxidoreductase (luciferase family)
MELGIGLPNAVAGTTGRQLTDWARAAEDAGFSTLGTIDRIVYSNYEPIVALSAAAAVTERIRLATDVMLGPLRQNPAMIAKQVLSLDALAGGGRAVLGIALGGRDDDYEISGIDMSARGAWLDDALPRIRAIWDGDGELESKVGPRPEKNGPTLLVGGYIETSLERAARHAHGWTQGGSTPDAFKESLDQLTEYWQGEEREGKPYTMALSYFSLGPDAQQNAERSLGKGYYAWLGEDTAQQIVDSTAKDADTVKQYVSGFEAAGCDELVLFPSSPDPEQVSLLAEAAGL